MNNPMFMTEVLSDIIFREQDKSINSIIASYWFDEKQPLKCEKRDQFVKYFNNSLK
jgi:hypothetical protein